MLKIGDKVRIINNKVLNGNKETYHCFNIGDICIILNNMDNLDKSFNMKSNDKNGYYFSQSVYIWDFIKVD